jgi:preprotein translocase subunit YajC
MFHPFPMHSLLTLIAQSTPPTTAGKATKSSGSYVPLLIIVALFGLVYVFFLRPRQQRMRQQQTGTRELAIGDEVMSAGGIFGRVVALDADQVEVEVAPGVVMTFVRRAISPRPAPGSSGTRGTRAGFTSARTPEPVDDPWEPEPDGPGDTAGYVGDQPPGGSSGSTDPTAGATAPPDAGAPGAGTPDAPGPTGG